MAALTGDAQSDTLPALCHPQRAVFRITHAPDVTRARSGDTIEIQFVNTCSAGPAEIEVRFNPRKPFVRDAPYQAHVGNDGTPVTLALVVDTHHDRKVYHYRVWINGIPGQDPRLEVDPF